MATFEHNLEKYADLGVKVAINVQKGQTLVINGPISNTEFVRMVAKKAYQAGAKNAHVEWYDDVLTRTKYDLAPEEAFNDYPIWKAKGFEEMAENGAAFMSIVSSDPDLLQGVNPEKIAAANKAAGQAMEKYRSFIQSDKVSWAVIAAPSAKWAAKVFPNLSKEEQMPALWDAIFAATRVDQADPVSAWKKHTDNLDKKVEYLNSKKFKKLHYKAKGTDLTIELHDNHIWVGAGSVNEDGTTFIANMPTEEVFTLPMKDGVNGTVASTKPLNYGGNLIENFSLTFEKGKIIDYKAEKGYETLKHLIETDEGSHYLGEVALVPYDSPISNTNLFFYNTLFDENASCHLAIGNAYAFCLEGGKEMSKEELEKHGANSSITHVDFMVGSAELDIDGVKADGSIEPIFRKGNWATTLN